MRKDPDAIRDEDGIVWTEDIDRLDYVRESISVTSAPRRRPVPWDGPGRRIGYSVLRPDAPGDEVSTGRFRRRVFWVKEHDRSERPGDTYKTEMPSEGVNPRTVAPGVWGEVTERAWGGPLLSEQESSVSPKAAKKGSEASLWTWTPGDWDVRFQRK
ncbi:DUF6009 family protein [Kitasatospora sp. NRRL B-11411]|uniref:DUF6009 family protein n=1 Tax=Kitasatospora sp. NRRL B-11411 TaxID=1463822 RepID=UPI00068A146A|nr:DUF6009 family protein [Kitasatospora sp. NRRL B-11411]